MSREIGPIQSAFKVVWFNPDDDTQVRQVTGTGSPAWVAQASATFSECAVSSSHVGNFYYADRPTGLDGTRTHVVLVYASTATAFTDPFDTGEDGPNQTPATGVVGQLGGMTVEEARDMVRRNIVDGSARSDDDFIDDAIMLAGQQFCRETQCVKRADSVSITADSSVFPTTTPQSLGFRPDRIIDVYLSGEGTSIKVVGYAELNTLVNDGIPDGRSSGPTHLAFASSTANGTLWPTPTAAWTATLRYWCPFTSWTAGATDTDTLDTVLNIPTDLIKHVLVLGACAIVKFSDKEQAFASTEWARFLQFILDTKGTGNLGAKSIQRNIAGGGQRRARRVIRETY